MLIIVLGLAFLGLVPGLQREFRIHRLPAAGLLGAPVFGAVFALSWMPCTGPTLGAVLGMATTGGQTDRAVVLAVAYCLGLGMPFVVFGLGFHRLLGVFRAVRRNSRWVTRVGGGLLILVGLALVTGGWTDFVIWLQTTVRRRRGEHLMTIVDGPGRPPTAPPPRRPNRAAGPAAQLVAAAHQHAYGADPALPARRRGHPRLGAAAARGQPRRSVDQYFVDAPRTGPDAGPARRASRCSRRPGSPRSTCCCSPRWSAASLPRLRDHVRALRTAAAGRARSGWTGCRSTPCGAGAGRPAPRPRSPPSCARRRWRVVRDAAADGLRREGLPQGDRQPAVPHLADRRAGRGRASAPGTAGTATGCWWPAPTTASATPCSSTTSPSSAPGSDAADLPPFCLTLTDFEARFLDVGPARVRSSATVDVDEAGGPTRDRRLLGQLPAAPRRRQRLPARPRLRAGAALHRPVRRDADQRSPRS